MCTNHSKTLQMTGRSWCPGTHRSGPPLPFNELVFYQYEPQLSEEQLVTTPHHHHHPGEENQSTDALIHTWHIETCDVGIIIMNGRHNKTWF